MFDCLGIDWVGARLVGFGHPTNQMVVLKAGLALFTLYFEVSLELSDFEVHVVSCFGENDGGVVADLLEVLFEGCI
jgi:hypothetical protein